MKTTKPIDVEFVKRYLTYNKDTGDFVWINHPGQPWLVGKKAGTKNSYGYWVLSINRTRYQAGRLALCLSGIDVPVDMLVDHINRDRMDNRLSNLRVASTSENGLNKELPKIAFHKAANKYQVTFKRKYIGLFGTKEEARNAYLHEKRIAA